MSFSAVQSNGNPPLYQTVSHIRGLNLALSLAVVLSFTGPTVARANGQVAAPAPAKVVLRRKGEVGRAERVKHTAVITVSFGGEPNRLTITEVDKVTVTKVDGTTGDVTLESRTESSEMKLPDGTSQPGDQPKAVETFVTHPNNALFSYSTTNTTDPSDGQAMRIGQAASIIFSDTAVTVGDKWSHDYKSDPTLKTKAAHADFEIVGATQVGGSNALKVKMTYKEIDAKPMTSSGVYMVDSASGDVITGDATFEGLDLQGQTATAKVHDERLDGAAPAAAKTGA